MDLFGWYFIQGRGLSQNETHLSVDWKVSPSYNAFLCNNDNQLCLCICVLKNLRSVNYFVHFVHVHGRPDLHVPPWQNYVYSPVRFFPWQSCLPNLKPYTHECKVRCIRIEMCKLIEIEGFYSCMDDYSSVIG